MPVSPNEAFLRLVWTHGLYTRLDPPGIEVIDPGSAGPEDGIDAVNARIALEGTEISGPVAIHERASDWRKHLHHIDSKYDRCILHVVAYDDAVVCRTDGSVVPTVTMSCPRELQERYLGLLEGTEISGPVAIHERASDWRKHLHHIDSKYDRCILHVVAYDDAVVCRTDGSVVPTVTMSCPRELQERYLGLLEGSESYRCGQTLAQMPEVKLYGLLTELTVERLERKYNDFLSLYRETGNDWNETFYVMLFRTMGAGSNREPYMKLARTVRYTDLCKVRESVASVEALLLGGAGLLQPIEFPDRYTAMLQQEFRHLSHRFEIAPMHRREWNLGSHNPHHAPLLRIVELAALLCSQEFMFSRLLGCRTPEQVREVLSVQASEYWTTHYLPGRRSRYSVKSFGDMMLDNLTINLVAPMMFTYGHVTSEEELKEAAVELLEKTKPENNVYIRGWKSRGVEAESAFFTQGLLQLSKEYCEKKRCAACNIGRKMLCCQ